jgi:HSP20 family protein
MPNWPNRTLESWRHATAVSSETSWRPAVDVYRTRTGWLVKFELAGVRLEDVQVEAGGSWIRISGQRRDRLPVEGCVPYSMEISYNRFERVIEFPTEVASARLELQWRDGLLLVSVLTTE